jgi:ATP/ADP translocase
LSHSTAIARTLNRLFNIEKGERKDILLLLCFSFLGGISFVFYSTATVSVFISTFKADMLPYAFIASGIIGYLLWYLFAKIQKYLAFGNLLASGYLFLLLSIVFLFFMAESSGNKWWYFSMFVWMRFFTFLNAVMFGGIFARIFNMQQGKRLFALISAGDVVSQMLGYFSIPVLLKSAGVSTLLWISMGGILFQLLLIFFLKNYYKEKFNPNIPKVTNVKVTEASAKDQNTKSYYLLMFMVSLLPMLGFYYVDYMFLNELKLEYTSGQAVAGFLGLFLGGVAVVELVARLFISGRLLTMYGLKFGINILPITLLLSTLLIVFFALMPGFAGLVFSMIAFSKLLERVLRFSFNEPAYQIFYQPVPAEQRFSLRTKMEGVPKALGVIIAGLLILVFNLLGFKASLYLNLLFLVVLIGWILVTKAAYKSYCIMLAQFVKRKFNATKSTELTASIDSMEAESKMIRKVSASEWETYVEMNKAILKAASDKSVNEKRCVEFLLHTLLPADYFLEWFEKDQMIVQLLKSRYQAGENTGEQLRILDLLSVLKNEEPFIKQQMLSKHPFISQMAVKCLQKHAVQMDAKEKALCKIWVQEMMGHQLWYYVVIEDIDDDPQLQELKQALKQENQQLTHLVFSMLSFVYDPAAVAEIREGITGPQSGDGKMLAHELLENFFDQEIREKITGLYLQEETITKQHLLQEFYPQQRLTPADRLIDIIRKEYQLVPLYLKLLALEAICKRSDSFKEDILLECLQSIHPLLAVSAAEQLRMEYPESYYKAYEKLPVLQQKKIEEVAAEWRKDLQTLNQQSLPETVPAALLPFLSAYLIKDQEEVVHGSCYLLQSVKEVTADSVHCTYIDAQQKVYVSNPSSGIFTTQPLVGLKSNPALSFFN